MIFRRKQPETLAEKFARLADFNHQMVTTTRSLISDLQRQGDAPLALANYSHLIHDYSDRAMMLWRQGHDPREAIHLAHAAHADMLTYRAWVDPDHQIPMAAIAGITDWDLVYALFWLIGKSKAFPFHFPNILSERYFAYSHAILHRLTDTDTPPALSAAVAAFQSAHSDLVDRNFRDLLSLLDDGLSETEARTIITRITANWPKRRANGFYNRSAPLLAGFDASNDLSVDYQLACVVRKRGWQVPANPHIWRWD